jgi:hypothetical protein
MSQINYVGVVAWTLLIVTSCTVTSATDDLGQFDVGSRAGRSTPGTKGIWSNREARFYVVDLVAFRNRQLLSF